MNDGAPLPLGVADKSAMVLCSLKHRRFAYVTMIRSTFLMGLAALVLLLQPVAAADPFIRVALQHGVSFSMPRNWVILTDNTRTTLDASVAARGMGTTSSDLAFAANLYDDQRNVLGMVNVRYYPSQAVTQAQIRAMTTADFAEFETYMREEMTKAAHVSGFSILGWNRVARTTISGAHALTYGFRRSAMPQVMDKSPMRLDFVRVLNGARSFTLTVAYREDQAALIAPICEMIKSSLRVESLAAR